MASRERPVDRGSRLGRASLERIGRELRDARTDRGLSIDGVAAAAAISNAAISRIERGLSPNVPYITLTRVAAVVGLDLVARTYPGPTPLSEHTLLDDFQAELHPSLRFQREAPFPTPGDQRAWDGMVLGLDWRFGVEAETAPHDAQASPAASPSSSATATSTASCWCSGNRTGFGRSSPKPALTSCHCSRRPRATCWAT